MFFHPERSEIDILCPWLLLDAPIQRDVTIPGSLILLLLRFRGSVKIKRVQPVDCITLPLLCGTLKYQCPRKGICTPEDVHFLPGIITPFTS